MTPAPSRKVERLLQATALAVLALWVVRALFRVDQSWDTWMYHLPFAARLWGVVPEAAFGMPAYLEDRYDGVPLLGEWLQGLLLWATGRPQTASLPALASLGLFVAFLRVYFQVPWHLGLIALAAVPLVHIHATAGYVDLPSNLAFAVLVLMTYLLYIRPGFATWRRQENETPEQKAQREAYEAERRELYRRWDAGDPEVRQLWLETREWSLEEFRDIFRILDIHINLWFFESEVDEPSKQIVDELIRLGIADDERPVGPVIVKIDEKLGLKKEKYRTNVILRSDGTTLYLTKDLALAKVKFEQYHVDRSIYVIDVRQSLHMQQTFKILELWGFKQAEKCYHLG